MSVVQLGDATLYTGDALEVLRTLPDESVQTCITSPPYFGLRDYGTAQWDGGDEACDHAEQRGGLGHASAKQKTSAGASTTYQARHQCKKCGANRIDQQIGLEPTVDEYVAKLVEVFREVRRVLRGDGTVWLNLGDSYAAARGGTHQPAETLAGGKGGKTTRNAGAIGLKHKDLIGIPWRIAFALQADGWYLRQDIIWHKPNPMPESVRDRCTKAHEYIFLLAKSERYYYDQAAIKEPVDFGDHRRNVDSIAGALVPGALPHSGLHRKWKTPDGWDTSSGDGGHGSFHREGREKGQTGYVKKSGNKARKPASARGVPVNTEGRSSGAVAGSVPWEGSMRNKRSVWTVATQPFKDAHFATFPPDLIRPCILAGAPPGGVVLDPFSGSGTTGMVALQEGRKYVGIELNPEYQKLAAERITPAAEQPRLFA